MRNSLSRFYCVLILAAGLCLVACGSEVATVSPTTPASNNPTTANSTTAANTPAPATTAIATTPAPATTAAATTSAPTTSAPSTTTAVATTAPAITTAVGLPGAGKVQELWSNIPDTADNLKELKFSNYAAIKSLYKIPADATFDSLRQDGDLFKRFNNGTLFLNPADVLQLNYTQTLRAMAGYDLMQADYDAQAGTPPRIISIAQGNFDVAAIDKAWTASKAIKGTTGSNTSYTFEKSNLAEPLQRIFIGTLSLISVPSQKMLILVKPADAAATVAGNLPSKTPITNNPAVKAMLTAFGDPLSVYISTQVISPLDPAVLLTPGAIQATFKAAQANPVPVPLVGGYAYYEDSAGVRTYLVANYYADEASAKTAQPILENRLRTGTSQRTRAPYSQYWEVASSETRGNVLLFKLNWKQVNSLNQFVFNRDFPAFQV